MIRRVAIGGCGRRPGAGGLLLSILAAGCASPLPEVADPAEVGQRVPDFVLPGAGEAVHLYALAGRVVVLDLSGFY